MNVDNKNITDLSIETEKIKKEIKEIILEGLNIEDVNAEEVDGSVSLFNGSNSVQLDSIDGLEVVMLIQKKYGVRFDNKSRPKDILVSIDSIASFVIRELKSSSETI